MPVATDPRSVNRDAAARMGREALEIIHQRHYTSANGVRIEIGAAIGRARLGTVSYPPESPAPAAPRAEPRHAD